MKEKNRCEGWVRHGGAFTLGLPQWVQCENEPTVLITFIDTQDAGKSTKRTLPACQGCWQRVIDAKLKIISVKPIKA